MRRTAIPVLVALLVALALAPAVVAGGWASVAVTDPPVQPPAGAATTLTLDVRQHGVTPVSWPGITVVATDDTGSVVRAAARADGPAGRYVAEVTFPKEGSWRLTFESTDLVMEGSAVIAVGAAPAAVRPAAAAPAPALVTPAAATMPDPVLIAIAALALIALLAGLGWLIRTRRGVAGRDHVHVSG